MDNQPDKANVWIVDIETSPCIVLVWGLGKQYVTKDQLIKDWHIMMFRAKKLGAPASSMVKMETQNGNDMPLLKKLWDIFNEADVIITQNGKKFDEPKIKARMMLKGFSPYRPFRHHDTFEQNTDKEFTSHSLDYLSDKFCTKYKKLKHKLFAGLSLWKACLGIKISLNPDPKAWKEMGLYCDNDVLSDEELYLKTRGWSNSRAPSLYHNVSDINPKCRICGGKTHKRGVAWKNAKTQVQRIQCQGCGAWDSIAIPKVSPKKAAA